MRRMTVKHVRGEERCLELEKCIFEKKRDRDGNEPEDK